MTKWVHRHLGDVAVVVAGQSPDGGHYNCSGEGLPFYQGKKEFTDRVIGPPQVWTRESTKEAFQGDVLMSVRAPVGPVNFAAERCCIGRGLAAIRPGDSIDANYLFYFLKHIEPQLTGNAGAVFPSINKGQIEKISLPLPPLDEQRRIVAILDEAFEGIAKATANAERNLANAREVFEGFLSAFFQRRERGWRDRQLKEICARITVGHVGSMANRYKDTGIPFLRSQNVRPFNIVLDNVVYIDQRFHSELGKSSLSPGDVAIVRTGYPGTAAVVPETLGTANCSDLVIMRPGPEVDARFLVAFFNSSFGKMLVSGKLVGAAQKHFNVGAAKNTVMHLPPLLEQRGFVERVDELRAYVDRLEKIAVTKAALLRELQQAVLQKAFSGQLTGKEAIAA